MRGEVDQENSPELRLQLNPRENKKRNSTLEETGSHFAEELEPYRKRVQDLEEECKGTVCLYQRQKTLLQREAPENWAATQIAERDLGDLRRKKCSQQRKSKCNTRNLPNRQRSSST